MSSAFHKLEGAKAKKFIERLNKTWRGSPFDAERTLVQARPLGFANDWFLAESSDASTIPEKKCVALDNGKECVPVEFNTDFIPAFAGRAGVMLDRDSVMEYVRFWFEYMRNGSDRFLLIEAVDDMPWREEATPQARKSLTKSIMPLMVIDASKNNFTCKATVLFRDTLFDCALDVTMNGKVTIESRETIAEGLTVIDSLTGF